ncbi:MAG: M1 family metallopeptidase [Candidatus Kapaibacteriota bacterium]
MKNLYHFIFIYFLSFSFLLAEPPIVSYYKDAGNIYYERLVDYYYYTAKVKFQPEENLIISDVSFKFKKLRDNVDSLVFYAPNFKIKAIIVNGFKANYYFNDKNLIINLPIKLEDEKENTISMSYDVKNYDGEIYFIGWDDSTGRRRKQIWSHRPHGWLPYADARVTCDNYITFDSTYKVFSNGERVEVINNNDGTYTWHYKMSKKHPYFSTALAIGKYDYKQLTTKRGLTEELWYYPEQENRFNETYQYSTEMIDFFENEFNYKYPWSLYRQAPLADYMYGAMETTTSTVFGDFLFIDKAAYYQRNYINVNAHELAHQWFGNYITHISNRDVCLTESFATFYAKIFEESIFGKNYYDWEREKELRKVLAAAEKDNYPVGSSFSGVARIYQKGSMVLSMLREIMGEKDFKRVINFYLNNYAEQEVQIEDLLYSIYKVTGSDYHWFFDEWVYRGGEPTYKVSYNNNSKGDSLFVKVAQVQPLTETTGIFKMPIAIDIYLNDGTKSTVNVWNDKADTTYNFKILDNKKVDFLVFDSDRKIIKNLKFSRSFEELSKQALRADNLLDRFDAILELSTVPSNTKFELYKQVFYKENYHLIKAEIIKQLSDLKEKEFTKIIKDAINSNDELVIQSVVENIKIVPKELLKEYETLLTGKTNSNYNIEKALENLCKSNPDKISKYLKLTRYAFGWRGLNIRMKWLEISYNFAKENNDHQKLNLILREIIDYSSISYEFETRMNALQLLKTLNYIDNEVARNIILASIHWNSKLRSAGKEVFDYFISKPETKEILIQAKEKSQWKDFQMPKIEKLFK